MTRNLGDLGLKNKIILITGSTDSVGKATAELFLSLGAKVIVNGNRPKEVSRTVKEFKTRGYDCFGVCADVSNSGEVSRMVGKILARFRTIDVLVNNATVGSGAKTEAVTAKEWRRVMGINLDGVFNCSRAVAPIMKKQKKGKIINFSSEAGRQGTVSKQGIVYAISKGGVLAFTRALSYELGPYNINVNAVVPGGIKINSLAKYLKESVKVYKNQTDLKRFGRIEDAAYLAVFLASNWADFITGQGISVNGGISKN